MLLSAATNGAVARSGVPKAGVARHLQASRGWLKMYVAKNRHAPVPPAELDGFAARSWHPHTHAHTHTWHSTLQGSIVRGSKLHLRKEQRSSLSCKVLKESVPMQQAEPPSSSIPSGK